MNPAHLMLVLTLSLLMHSTAIAIEIIAHRGFSAHAPENTVSAFKLAWAAGADACEVDIHLTSDGHIIALHDKDTLRTAGGVNHIAKDTTLAALSALDVGIWKAEKWKGEPIPTLASCLATMPSDRGRFLIEVKSGPEIVAPLAKLLEPMKNRAHQLAIIGFDEEVVSKSKAAMPWLKVYLLKSGKERKTGRKHDIADAISFAKKHQLDGLNLGSDWDWNEELVKQVRAAGLGLYVWTINKPELARKLAGLGVDGITTDDPELIRQAIGE